MENETKTKLCKHCQSEIPEKAKVCPYCRRKQESTLKKVLLIILMLWVIGFIVSLASSGSLAGDMLFTLSSAGLFLCWVGIVVSALWTLICVLQKKDKTKPINTLKKCALILFLCFIVVIATSGKDDEENENMQTEKPIIFDAEEFKTSCMELTYKDIARNPENYVGKNFYATVKISGVETVSDFYDFEYVYRAYTNDEYDMWMGDFLWLYDYRNKEDEGYVKILEDDIVVVYGTFEEMTQTENKINGATGEDVGLNIKYAELIESE